MENKKFLPLGSVVMLKNAQKKLMIIGYTPVDINKKDKIYDYCGCLYPEGVLNDTKFLFDEKDIETIYFNGYESDEYKEFNAKLLDFLKNDVNKTISNNN